MCGFDGNRNVHIFSVGAFDMQIHLHTKARAGMITCGHVHVMSTSCPRHVQGNCSSDYVCRCVCVYSCGRVGVCMTHANIQQTTHVQAFTHTVHGDRKKNKK